MEIVDYIIADDATLVRRVLEGDNHAFEYLFNRYRDGITRLFVQRLGSSAASATEADDLLQETFVKVYVNLHRYSSQYTFGQWLYTIARNTFVDYVRRRQEDMSIDDRFSPPASSLPTPEECVINLQQRSQIEEYLGCLTPYYRRLFELRFYDECSYEEIAEKLQLPMGTIKTGIHRMRERMCQLISEGDNK